MHIGDKTRDQAMRCEVFKQANETEEIIQVQKHTSFLDHVRQFEKQIELSKQAGLQSSQSQAEVPAPRVITNPLKEFQSLKTKTYQFEGKKGSAMDRNAKSAADHQSYHTTNPEGGDPDKSAHASGFAEFYNNPSVSASVFQKKGAAGASVGLPTPGAADAVVNEIKQQEQSLGPINIVTGTSKPDLVGRKSTQATS